MKRLYVVAAIAAVCGLLYMVPPADGRVTFNKDLGDYTAEGLACSTFVGSYDWAKFRITATQADTLEVLIEGSDGYKDSGWSWFNVDESDGTTEYVYATDDSTNAITVLRPPNYLRITLQNFAGAAGKSVEIQLIGGEE